MSIPLMAKCRIVEIGFSSDPELSKMTLRDLGPQAPFSRNICYLEI
jgi:hypothetical protein